MASQIPDYESQSEDENKTMKKNWVTKASGWYIAESVFMLWILYTCSENSFFIDFSLIFLLFFR